MPESSKGPWKFFEGRADRREMSRIVKADDAGFLIGYVLCENIQQNQRQEDIANARLIAAAPELLEFVKSLHQFPEINPNNYDHDDVCKLNEWAIGIVNRAAELEAKVASIPS